MTTLILVHGACHGGWCWEAVVPLLEAAGLRVLTPDLADRGAEERDPIARWGGFVAELAARQSGRVLLAGHSRGGAVISAAAEARPDAIGGLIYVAASLLPRGQTMTGAWRAFSGTDAEWIDPAPDGMSFTIRADAYHRLFCPMADADAAARAQARLGREPMAAFKTPLRVSDARFGRIPRAYIETSRDQIIPIAFQRSMQAALPCSQTITLDSDHSPFLAMPDRLAEALITLAREGPRASDEDMPAALRSPARG